MIAIRADIAQCESGRKDAHDNVLTNAPQTAQMLLADQWNHDYTRQEAAYPVDSLRGNKYWPAVARVDNAYGDRNLVCSCPPLEDYIDTAPEQERAPACPSQALRQLTMHIAMVRSEERRVGKEWVGPCRSRGPPDH